MPTIPDRLSVRARETQESPIRALFSLSKRPGMISLAGGWPATELLDEPGLGASLGGLTASERREILQYGATSGDASYEQACRDWLADAASLCLPGHRFLSSTGAQQAIDLVARAVVGPGDRVAVEAPSYPAAIACFRGAGAEIVEVPSDDHGMQVDLLEGVAGSRPLKAVYIVPTYGNPTGRCLSMERRRKLASLSAAHAFFVVEDDPYAGLGFGSRWPLPVAGYAGEGHADSHWAIYISSFSKILGPGLRAGFALLPADVGAAAERSKQTTDIHSARWGQAAVSRYLSDARMPSQLDRLRGHYAARCDELCAALDRELVPLGFSYRKPEGGMFVWGSLPAVDSRLLLDRSIAHGALFVPGGSFFAGNGDPSTLRLSFAGADVVQIREGVRRIARAAAELLVN